MRAGNGAAARVIAPQIGDDERWVFTDGGVRPFEEGFYGLRGPLPVSPRA